MAIEHLVYYYFSTGNEKNKCVLERDFLKFVTWGDVSVYTLLCD